MKACGRGWKILMQKPTAWTWLGYFCIMPSRVCVGIFPVCNMEMGVCVIHAGVHERVLVGEGNGGKLRCGRKRGLQWSGLTVHLNMLLARMIHTLTHGQACTCTAVWSRLLGGKLLRWSGCSFSLGSSSSCFSSLFSCCCSEISVNIEQPAFPFSIVLSFFIVFERFWLVLCCRSQFFCSLLVFNQNNHCSYVTQFNCV